MNLSLNEVENLVRKAARGVGLDPGRADDVAAAAAMLASHPVPVCAILHRALSSGVGEPLTLAQDGTRAACHATSTAYVGPSALDLLIARPAGFEIALDAVDEPLLMMALAVVASRRYGVGLLVETENGAIAIEHGRRTDLTSLANARAIQLVLRRSARPAGRKTQPHTAFASRYDPAKVSDTGLAALESLACRTYVPASVSSRLQGAGAGLTDND